MRFLIAICLVISTLVISPPASAETTPGPVRFVPESPEAWTRIHAKFVRKPDLCEARQTRDLHAAYPGVVEIGRRADGRLYLVTELTFPQYLSGIAEVPRDWPLEALKAQVVAARTYAVSHMNPSTELAKELRFNICATDACQVYRGSNVEKGAWGSSWAQAVRETEGEILEHNGKPASTFYFSTSNGQTYSNKDVFGGSPLPYLKSVKEEDDTASPVSSWKVEMPLGDMSEALRKAGSWPGGTIESVTQEGETVRLSGSGRNASLSLDDLRKRLNNQAVCLVPKRYPTLGPNGRPYPQVVPSKWMNVRQEENKAVFEGRGWGHGVGMVQWGLKGKAEKGMGYADMLSYYYGGLRPVRQSEPGAIRVGLSVDIEEITVERMGSVKVEGAVLPDGPVRLTSGSSIGYAKTAPSPAVLVLKDVTTTGTSIAGGPASFSFNLSSSANVRLKIEPVVGGAAFETTPEPRDRGNQNLTWDTSSTGIQGGEYRVLVIANDGVDEVASGALTVAVTAPSPSPRPSISPTISAQPRSPSDRPRGLLILSIGLLVALGSAVVLFRIRRGQR